MYQDHRVIYNTLDLSPKVNDFRSGESAFAYLQGSYLYLGSVLPFNNIFFEMGTKNVNAGITPTVKIWWGNAWTDAVDVIDDTTGMTVNGRLSWCTDRLKGWDVEQTTEDVSGLSSFKIYDRFWVRINWGADFSGGTTLKYVGQKFSEDTALYSLYPDLNSQKLRNAFVAGGTKLDWNEQHYIATEEVIKDLKKNSIVISRSQLMDWKLFESACCHRVATLVYSAFGRPYFDQLQTAEKWYKDSINIKYFGVDLNATGRMEPVERIISTGFMKR